MGKRQAEILAERGKLKHYKIKKGLSVLPKNGLCTLLGSQMPVWEEERK